MDNSSKVYVGVNARFEPDGKLTPLSVAWEDGSEYEIDRVLNVCRAASLKAGEWAFGILSELAARRHICTLRRTNGL